jgi:hypothetical protein
MLETWNNDHADYRRTPHGDHPGTTPDSIQLSTWEWEDGQDGARSRRAATSAAS